MQISGAIAYYHYLSGRYFIHSWGEDSVHIAAFINLFVFGVLMYDVFKLDHTGAFKKDIEEYDKEIKQIKSEKEKAKSPKKLSSYNTKNQEWIKTNSGPTNVNSLCLL